MPPRLLARLESPGPAGARAVSAAASARRQHHFGYDRTGARSIVQVRGTQRGGRCHDHRVLGLAPRSRVAMDMSGILACARLAASPSPLHLDLTRFGGRFRYAAFLPAFFIECISSNSIGLL